jgi:alpha-L-fucosidase
LEPPIVETGGAEWTSRGASFEGQLRELGDAGEVEVGFEYRRKKHMAEMYEADDPWKMAGKLEGMQSAGEFSASARGLDGGREWEYRAVVKHPKVTLYGMTKTLGAEGR